MSSVNTFIGADLDDSLLEVVFETLVLPWPEIVLAGDDRQHNVGVLEAPEVGHELRHTIQVGVTVNTHIVLLGLWWKDTMAKDYLSLKTVILM